MGADICVPAILRSRYLLANKGYAWPDKLHWYRVADLHLCFCICDKQVFSGHDSVYSCIRVIVAIFWVSENLGIFIVWSLKSIQTVLCLGLNTYQQITISQQTTLISLAKSNFISYLQGKLVKNC